MAKKRGKPRKKPVVTKPKIVAPREDEKITTEYQRKQNINYTPIPLKLKAAVRKYVESGTWRGTDEDVKVLLKFYQVTFRDSPEKWMECGKCFERGCKRLHEYWQEEVPHGYSKPN